MREPPYYINYSKPRLFTHNIITSKYFDLAIAAVIGLNVVTMAMEFYMMPKKLEYALKVFNYFFTAVFVVEACMKVLALGLVKYIKNRWNQLDVFIVGLSVAGIVLEKMESDLIPINPTIIRVFRVLRIARVLKLLKMAKGIRALLDTVMQALPQVGNLGLLFFLLFFIFAALGVELFGRLECTEDLPCEGLGEHAHFKDFGMAFLTLFRVATGDNWNGIMKDTLRDNCDYSSDCIKNCCISPIIAPLYFVIFVLMAQFVLVNVVVAVLMKHLEESHKQMDDDLEMDAELERELAAEVQMKKLAEMGELRKAVEVTNTHKVKSSRSPRTKTHKPLVKMASLPPNFVFPFNSADDRGYRRTSLNLQSARNTTDCVFSDSSDLHISPNFMFTPSQTTAPSINTPNVNIRQASPDETESKVSVANLSPVPLRSSFGSTLNVPSAAFTHQRSPTTSVKHEFDPNDDKKGEDQAVESSCSQNPPVDDWACVFQSMNSDPYKVHFLPVLRNDVIGSANLCDNKLLESLVVNRNRSISNAFLPMKATNQSDDCDSGCASIDRNIASDQNTGDNSLRTAHMFESNSGEASLSSPSLLGVENFQGGDKAPLIIRRLRKKLINLGGESSLSSQSDVPEENKDKSFTTDSTSLEC
uniref:Putative calcium-channel-like protein n=1 Tax=Cupiennius salei TaxID=6928 RepID=A0A061QLN8_CUPSA